MNPGKSAGDGPRVLVVGRDYFFYTREIVAELQAGFGAAVDYVPIDPPSRLFNLAKRWPSLARRWRERHHRRAIAALRDRCYDIVLFIQVHQIGHQAAEYRAAFGDARFVLYYWDSLKTHDYLPYARYFDALYTFDPEDARRHGMAYLPLFYAERFRALREVQAPSFDLSFVGTAVSLVRYEQLERLRGWAREAGVSFFDYLLVSPFFYARQLLRGRRLRGVRFRSMPEARLLEAYADSRAVIDLPNNAQSGFTMRTFEALGAHRKLITTNHRITAEEFYTPTSVFVLGVDGEVPVTGFLTAPCDMAPAVERYSLRSWIARLIGGDMPTAHPRTDDRERA